MKLRHPGTTLGFRFTPAKAPGGPSMAYVTDNELGGGGQYEVPASWRRDFVTFLKGVDLLIHDAMYTPKELEQHRGWGHCVDLLLHMSSVPSRGAARAPLACTWRHESAGRR